MKLVSEVGKYWGNYGNDAMCADTRLAVAGTTCCDQNNSNPHNICIFRGEHTTYDTAKQRCAEKGLVKKMVNRMAYFLYIYFFFWC